MMAHLWWSQILLMVPKNIDASIPTGKIFGIHNRLVELDHLPQGEKIMLNSLQSGLNLVVVVHVLYSSTSILCTSFGPRTHAFTLDHSTGDFILTHPNIKIPSRGQIYSVNDARPYFAWPPLAQSKLPPPFFLFINLGSHSFIYLSLLYFILQYPRSISQNSCPPVLFFFLKKKKLILM